MESTFALAAVAAAGLASLGLRGARRAQLSRAKHPSLAGHSRMAKRVARLIPGYAYDERMFFESDGAPEEVVRRRREGLDALADHFARHYPKGIALTLEARDGLPDLQFTSRYRVPFQYGDHLRSRLTVPAFVQSSDGVTVTDLDGNRLHDVGGSYGVNVFGYDFYKACIAEAVAAAGALGPVLGAYHPCVADNVARLREISGHDEVSFHMSGPEAVMQAVRLARYHTGRSHVVRFAGAYHGWWEDVQPGPGNPMPPRETYTLRDLDDRSLRVLRQRRDIACVLVNPLQAMHPNRNAPGDSALVDSGRDAGFDRAAYTRWLQALREVCTERGIALIFDEVFLGFRLARGGAQAYFGVKADLVTYGKTLGGGLPVGVVVGERAWMRRYRPDRPADICFARGTFNAHPYVMAAMNAFLRRLDTPAVCALYDGLDETWEGRRARLNDALSRAAVPVRVAGLATVWTVLYATPARYNWLFQFYLRREGLLLSWVGSGRMIFSLNFTDADFDEVVRRFVAAAIRMRDDGWWWHDGRTTNRDIRRRLLREMLRQRLGNPGLTKEA